MDERDLALVVGGIIILTTLAVFVLQYFRGRDDD